MIKKIIRTAVFIFIILLFSFFRLKPLYYQQVGYTYDQGRDFLKAAQIVTEKDLTLIGPTTGIQGLFHGVWYYYILAIPFLLFRGSGIGFYYFNFFIHLASFLAFTYFLKKNFGTLITLIISLLIATSPYFIFTSLFVGNNIMVLPTFLAFLIVNFYLIERKTKIKNQLFFLAGLLLGLTTEFELAFGFFLIPSYFLLLIILKKLRSEFLELKHVGYFTVGLVTPFIPRLLFELKNGFMQTKILINTIFGSTQVTDQTYFQIFQERVKLFTEYYRSLFISDRIFLLFGIFLLVTLVLMFEFKIKKYFISSGFYFFLILSLFFLSTMNKNSLFWGNYFEGIQYLFLFAVGTISTVELKSKTRLLSALKIILIIALITTSIVFLFEDLKKKPALNGTLALHQKVVDHIVSQVKKEDDYCVKVYTPPVLPFTYRYLFLEKRLTKNISEPEEQWVDGQCWFILEADDNSQRREKWMKENIPRKAKLVNKKSFDSIEVALYER